MSQIICKKCQSTNYRKVGLHGPNKIQRYQRKVCNRHFTMIEAHGRPMSQRLLVLSLYAGGLSINSIVKCFSVSVPAVLRWIKILGDKMCIKQKSEGHMTIMKLDKMCHYVGSKKQALGKDSLMIILDTNSSADNVMIKGIQY